MNGIILAGGRSLRFGEDKAFVKIGEGENSNSRLLIEIVIGLLAPLFDNLIVVTNYPEKYAGYPVTVTTDRIKGIGPLGGIHAGLLASASEYNFVMACDMPLISPKLISYMKTRVGSDVIVPRREGKAEPLCAVYSKRCIPAIEEQIKTGNYKIQDFFPGVEVEYVEEEDLRKFDPAFMSFLNLNTKRDLERIYECLKRLKLSASV